MMLNRNAFLVLLKAGILFRAISKASLRVVYFKLRAHYLLTYLYAFFFIVTVLQKENPFCGIETLLELILSQRFCFYHTTHQDVGICPDTPLHQDMLVIARTSAHCSLSCTSSCHSRTCNGVFSVQAASPQVALTNSISL